MLAAGMQALAKGNKNKKKTIRLPQPGAGPAAVEVKERSPVRSPSSASLPEGVFLTKPDGASEPTPAKKGKRKANGKGKAYTYDANLHADAPSQRADLPPNVVVTRVDVEAAGWEPGLGAVIAGTSRDWKAEVVVVVAAEEDAQMADADEEEAEAEVEVGEDWGKEWAGWAGVGAVEKRWDQLRALAKDEPFKEGARVAVKVSAPRCSMVEPFTTA